MRTLSSQNTRLYFLENATLSIVLSFIPSHPGIYTFQITAVNSLESMGSLPQKTSGNVSWYSKGKPQVPTSTQF